MPDTELVEKPAFGDKIIGQRRFPRAFAPSLKYRILHPSENGGGEDMTEDASGADLFITTYGMLLKYSRLKNVMWNILVLDEAQAIKNSATKQAKAVKQLKAAFRVAMTGTLVENKLSDLWSIFDFLNKCLLGSSGEFADITRRMSEGGEGYKTLKCAVGPFILRRLKTDLVSAIKKTLEPGAAGIERKGLILSSLMKFKQICNHPDHKDIRCV